MLNICETWFVFILQFFMPSDPDPHNPISVHRWLCLHWPHICKHRGWLHVCMWSLSVLNYRLAQISITPLPMCHGFMQKHNQEGFGGDISASPAETAKDAAHLVCPRSTVWPCCTRRKDILTGLVGEKSQLERQ